MVNTMSSTMSNEKVKIDVYFRKFPEGDVIAIWKEESTSSNYRSWASYMHVGQHSECSPELVIDLDVAREQEYLPLKKEMETLGYVVNVL